jgi:hypothetical protein
VTLRAMPVHELLVAGMDVRSIADDIRAPHVAMMMCCRCMRLIARGAGLSLPEARCRQRDRPEGRRGEESDQGYFRTEGKAHGWLPRGGLCAHAIHIPCGRAWAIQPGNHPQAARREACGISRFETRGDKIVQAVAVCPVTMFRSEAGLSQLQKRRRTLIGPSLMPQMVGQRPDAAQ